MTTTEEPDPMLPSVVFIDHSSERGGAELALARLLRTKQAWRAALVVPPASQTTPDAFLDLQGQTKVVRTGPAHAARATAGTGAAANAALAWRLVRSAASLVRNRTVREADALVANTTRASVYVTLAGLLMRKPVIVHIRDLIEPDSIGPAATRLLREFVLPRAAGVVANSRASLDAVKPYLRSGCITEIIPSPAGLTVADVDSVAVSPAVRRIGMVARIDPWKGQELLVRAFARAFPGGDQRLILFGGAAFGHDRFPIELRQLADELGVGGRLELAGHVSDVAGAIESLDVCVQCSLRPEPLGQNVLQYLAAGKAIVVADEGGPVEWVSDGVNGVTFRARNVDSLAAALRRLCGDATLRANLARAAVATPGLLDDDEIGQRVNSLIREVLER